MVLAALTLHEMTLVLIDTASPGPSSDARTVTNEINSLLDLRSEVWSDRTAMPLCSRWLNAN
jgi:hypothetical protein